MEAEMPKNLPSKSLSAIVLTILSMTLPLFAKSEPVMNLITINTSDGAGYAAWAKNSARAIATSNKASAMGLCSPMAGAEQMGDHYLWTFFDSQATAWSTDSQNPVMRQEVAKMKVQRTIKEWDNWRILRAAPATSDRGYFWNIIVKAENPASYLSTLDKLDAALKANGHDLTMQVFMADTGRRAGHFMVSLSASEGAKLGAAMDDRTEPWFGELLAGLEGGREYVHGFAMQCETFYAAPQN
jgi:hypothetical protein